MFIQNIEKKSLIISIASRQSHTQLVFNQKLSIIKKKSHLTLFIFYL